MLNNKAIHLRHISRRIFIMIFGKISLLGLIASRLFYMQFFKRDEYKTLADSNSINLIPIQPHRGKIFDLYSQQIASSAQNFQVCLDKKVKYKELMSEIAFIFELLNIDQESQNIIINRLRKNAYRRGTLLIDTLSWQNLVLFEEHQNKITSLYINISLKRFYPYGDVLAPILGFMAPINEHEAANLSSAYKHTNISIGKIGIEKHYEETLKGEFGYKQMEVNAYGKFIRELSNCHSTNGVNLHLNIDADLCKTIASYLEGLSCSVVVMDISSGAILSMISQPSYDPGSFAKLSNDYWQSLQNDPFKPLINKAIQSTYPPGSTFKLITILAALESGIAPSETINCNGTSALGTNSFRCASRMGHGLLDMHRAIKHSCNTYMYEITKQIGVDKILEIAFKFGLGQNTGIDLPNENKGLLPSREWKWLKLKQKWTLGDSLNIAIGQGAVSVTPLQLARLAAAIANGGTLLTPRINGSLAPSKISIDPKNLEFIKQAMYSTVNSAGGTAYASKLGIDTFEMAGKTGTSQVQSKASASDDLSRTSLAWHKRNHGIFIGFAPFHAPKYSICVFNEHGGNGSKAAAPIAKQVMRAIYEKYHR